MDLKPYDGKYVRLVTLDGDVFDGCCTCNSAEYNCHEYGKNEDGLDIDGWLFFESDIRSVSIIPEGEGRLWMGRPLHEMRLDPDVFCKVESGQKAIEMRLFDEKRQKVRVGDLIRFEKRTDPDELLWAEVTALYRFPSFEELYKELPLLECGYTEEELPSASFRDMERYYSLERQAEYGVLGIRIKLI